MTCQGSPVDEGRREVEIGQVALKRPAIGHRCHFLAAGHARPRDPREQEASLVHPGHVPCPEKCATREVVVVLEREDPGALLESLGKFDRRASVAW